MVAYLEGQYQALLEADTAQEEGCMIQRGLFQTFSCLCPKYN